MKKHLYEVAVSYGILIVVAESKDEVLSVIKASKWYEMDFNFIPPAGVEKQAYKDATILKFTKEIVGYEVKGESKVIADYQE